MIEIQQGETCEVVVTVTEKTTLSNPYFLWVFEPRQAVGGQVVCISANTSTVTVRYDKFTFTEMVNPDPLEGELTLSYTGEWNYTVYQKTGAASLTIPAASNIVETGICKVIGTASAVTEYESNFTIVVYE